MFLLKCYLTLVVVTTVVWSTSGEGFCSDVVDCKTLEVMIAQKLFESEVRLSGRHQQHADRIRQLELALDCMTSATVTHCEADGWIVIQRRLDGSVDFQRGWQEYVDGFGQKDGEFWLGLENLHHFTSRGTYELRVDLEDWEGNKGYAKYSIFFFGDATTNYKMSIGGYSGTAGDSMSVGNGMAFSTKDADHDTSGGTNCADQFKGAWWYGSCHEANLNGFYHQGGPHSSFADGVNWKTWKGYQYSLKFVEMKIRQQFRPLLTSTPGSLPTTPGRTTTTPGRTTTTPGPTA